MATRDNQENAHRWISARWKRDHHRRGDSAGRLRIGGLQRLHVGYGMVLQKAEYLVYTVHTHHASQRPRDGKFHYFVHCAGLFFSEKLTRFGLKERRVSSGYCRGAQSSIVLSAYGPYGVLYAFKVDATIP